MSRFRLTNQLVEAMRHHMAGGTRPQLPEAGKLLWRLFVDLSRTRTYHASGPNPISYAEIEAFRRIYRWPLEPHHVDVIRALDSAWLDLARKKTTSAPDGVKRVHPATAKINPAAFDAVFG
jgi:hypothetical protein